MTKVNPRPDTRRLRMERLEERTLLAVNIVPQAQTASASGADDIAIWIHPTDTAKSTIIGTAKTSSTSLRVYNLAGQQIQSVSVAQVNNIDLRYNFPLGAQRVPLVAGSNRSNNSIALFAVDPQTGLLQNVAARTISTGMSIYGCAMSYSPVNGKYYVFASSEAGQVQQWELFDNGAGKVDAKQVRNFSVGSKVEGLVADDVAGVLYVGEENVALWRYAAEPNGGAARTQVDKTGAAGHLAADIEGLSIYYAPAGAGYVLASSQGSNEFAVYRREGNNSYLGSFKLVAGGGIDAVTDTDGIDVTNFPLGGQYPHGLFVAQDNDQNFKLVRWDAIAATLGGLVNSDATWDPRAVGSGPQINQPPTVDAGKDQTLVLGGTTTLRGATNDDGSPASPGTVSVKWEQVSGPAAASFASTTAVETAASFPSIGEYVLRLHANDGQYTTHDDVTVRVTVATPQSPSPQSAVFQDGAGYGGTRDTMLVGASPTQNRGAAATIGVDGSPDYAVLMSWDIASIPASAIVTSAQIVLQVTDKSKDAYPIYGMNRPWQELQATWRQARTSDNWAAAGAQNAADHASAQVGVLTAPSTGPAIINLSTIGVALVQSWITSPESNFGFIFQNYSPAKDGIDFASREATNAAMRPKLVVNYTLPAPVAAAAAQPQEFQPANALDFALNAPTEPTARTAGPIGESSLSVADLHDAALLALLVTETRVPTEGARELREFTAGANAAQSHGEALESVVRPWRETLHFAL